MGSAMSRIPAWMGPAINGTAASLKILLGSLKMLFFPARSLAAPLAKKSDSLTPNLTDKEDLSISKIIPQVELPESVNFHFTRFATPQI